jgi:hypothetical protein
LICQKIKVKIYISINYIMIGCVFYIFIAIFNEYNLLIKCCIQFEYILLHIFRGVKHNCRMFGKRMMNWTETISILKLSSNCMVWFATDYISLLFSFQHLERLNRGIDIYKCLFSWTFELKQFYLKAVFMMSTCPTAQDQ